MGSEKGIVIGVLKDFHFYSLHQSIDPMVIRLNDKQRFGTILVRIKGNKTTEALTALEKLSKEVNPKYPFTYQFADEQYAKLYSNEQLTGRLTNYFALIAILVSCLGLFGLSTFTAEQRTREIGVRKVLGASVTGIVSLLTTDFLKPVVTAVIISIPVSMYIMSRWLEDFAYKISMDWCMFAASGVIAIIIALLTVTYQAVKTAISNPVKSLRIE